MEDSGALIEVCGGGAEDLKTPPGCGHEDVRLVAVVGDKDAVSRAEKMIERRIDEIANHRHRHGGSMAAGASRWDQDGATMRAFGQQGRRAEATPRQTPGALAEP
eukprot:2669614-Prymnesium_polylepis.1